VVVRALGELGHDLAGEQLQRLADVLVAVAARLADEDELVDPGGLVAPDQLPDLVVGQVEPPWRKDFERSLSDIEAGAIKGIVFFKLDRYVRDHKDFDRALAVCEKHGAFLSSVTEPIDTTTPMGEAIARLLVQFARMESQTIALRVAAQAEQRARLGKPWRRAMDLRQPPQAPEASTLGRQADLPTAR
jgi:hypothetical protein